MAFSFFKLRPRAAKPATETVHQTEVPATIQGYVDERTLRHVSGWLRNLQAPDDRLAFEVTLALPEETRVIYRGIADRLDPALRDLAVGDGQYGFRVDFPSPLTPRERDHLEVRASLTGSSLPLAPQTQGFVDERSIHHVAGWIRDRSDPEARIAFEVILPGEDGDQIIAAGRAGDFNPVLAQLAIGDGFNGFRVLFPNPLTEGQRDRVIVRPAGSTRSLDLAPALRTAFEPISHLALDIVNNCNLRCPFCVYDYSATRKTQVMPSATFDACLRLIPFVSDGNFWLSCLHEATMHPELQAFIERVPRQWRHKVMYTTNLARPMPDDYFRMLGDSGLHHLNISLESLDPAIYERMRKGARWRIFSANWEKLLAAVKTGSAPPRLRYNLLAYKSNLAEIPGLVALLRAEKLAWQVEVRHTFDVAHMPDGFRQSEFLDHQDWAWLGRELAGYPAEALVLVPPPAPASAHAPEEPLLSGPPSRGPLSTESGWPAIPRPLNIRMEWDGKLIVYGEWQGAEGQREHEQFVVTNINYLRDPRQFLISL